MNKRNFFFFDCARYTRSTPAETAGEFYDVRLAQLSLAAKNRRAKLPLAEDAARVGTA